MVRRCLPLVLACACAFPAWASEGISLKLDRTLAPPPPKVPRESVRFLSADTITGTETTVVTATGNVSMRQRGLAMSADRVDYSSETDVAVATGNVRLQRQDGLVAGPPPTYRRGEICVADGVTTRYAHLSSLTVAVGERVAMGQRLGQAGQTGRATGTHLHLEVRKDGVALDPLGAAARPAPAPRLPHPNGTSGARRGADPMPPIPPIPPIPPGFAAPAHTAVARSSAGATRPGASPRSAHTAASTAIGTSISAGDSCASPAAAERGVPRKTIPTTLTKQATASAPVAASTGAATATQAVSREIAARTRPR